MRKILKSSQVHKIMVNAFSTCPISMQRFDQVTSLPGAPDGSTPVKAEAEDMTSKDYYFDSYAHFGIHEVSSKTWLELLFHLNNQINGNVNCTSLPNIPHCSKCCGFLCYRNPC